MDPKRSKHRPSVRTGLSRTERAAWAQTYARTRYSRLPWFSVRPSPLLVRAVRERWLTTSRRVLDVGCGAGTNVLWLAQRGFRAFGVDIAPGAIAAARSRGEAAGVRASFQVGEATRLPFPRAHFGATIDFGCFHSLPLRLRARYAAEIARVLRPGDTFVLAWIGREETRSYGPPHRPSLNEVTRVFEPRFVFSSVQHHPPEAQGAWRTPGGSLALYAARLVRRTAPQPRPR